MIALVVGTLGTGKSGFATARAIERCRKLNRRKDKRFPNGAMLVSNIKLTPPDGIPFLQVPIGDYGLDVDAIYDARNQAFRDGRRVVFVVDEAGIVMDNRFWGKAPPALKGFFKHSRKYGWDVWATAHDADEVDVAFRRITSFTYALERIPGGGEEGDDRMPWLLTYVRWRRTQVGVKGQRFGRFVSFVRWRREWTTWYDTDEIVELNAPGMKYAAPPGMTPEVLVPEPL